ncbi:MAG: glutamate-1-semialdehyde 2,1-aminomutase [Deferribacterota bacterium]|nr:glutamate-1-semialdehyde 2,1-aminomutase [Deferribacterota bacterium]
MDLYERAKICFPGGVNSPVRAFTAVGGKPLMIDRGKGSKIYDINNNEYIDYVMSYGPLILGHCDDNVIKFISNALKKGTSFGATNELEIRLAELIISSVPSIEMIRFVNSGTEAVMSAIRLARAYTKRDKILKFEGCYHGHSDYLLSKAGSGLMSLNIPTTPGVPESLVKDTLTATYNDLISVEEQIKGVENNIACIIVEPVAGNMGVVLPDENFLRGLKSICERIGALLIFDEVITGFRVALGGAQERYKIMPDLTCLGKIIGGGLPIGAFGGKKEILELLAPIGPVYQAGTLSGNPVVMSAGIATLEKIRGDGFYSELKDKTIRLFEGMKDNLRSVNLNFQVNYTTGMGNIFFCDREVRNFNDLKDVNRDLYSRYFHHMLSKGIYLAPSQFEATFLSDSHQIAELDKTLDYQMDFLKTIK